MIHGGVFWSVRQGGHVFGGVTALVDVCLVVEDRLENKQIPDTRLLMLAYTFPFYMSAYELNAKKSPGSSNPNW